jgi:hypothetical protein
VPGRDNEKVKNALRRVIKRIMIMKRVSIIRQVNDVIEKVCHEPDESI